MFTVHLVWGRILSTSALSLLYLPLFNLQVDRDGTVMGEDSGNESSSDEGDDMDEDMGEGSSQQGQPKPANEPVVDADGFTLVQKSGRKGRR